MAETLKKGTLFAPETVKDLFTKVAGKSSLAKLAASIPVEFNGSELFTFNMDDEVNIVAEGAKKDAGSIKVEPVTIVPIKVEYGARITDEFMYAAEEKQLEILKAFNDGYARKVARALDIMAIHGLNPRTKTESLLIGNNCFNKAGITKIKYEAVQIEENIESAIAAIDERYDVNGAAVSKDFSSTLASLTVNGVKQYPELGWGANPGTVKGLPFDVNSTVSFNSASSKALFGDFSAFKWGFAKEIPMEVIQYGDPDQSGEDLKAHNQVYLRCETYIGWGILDKNAFSMIEAQE